MDVSARPDLIAVSARLEPDGSAYVTVSGDLDFATRTVFAVRVRDVLETEPVGLTVDLSGIAFMDSAGLHALLELTRASTARGLRLSFRNIPGSVAVVMEVSGLRKHLPIEP